MEGTLTLLADDEMIGGSSLEDSGVRRPGNAAEDGDEFSMMDLDDDLLIDDQTGSL
jgi:hypothetical protein